MLFSISKGSTHSEKELFVGTISLVLMISSIKKTMNPSIRRQIILRVHESYFVDSKKIAELVPLK